MTIVATVLTKYKADTSDQKKALKSLRGEERRRHKALLAETEAQNAKLDQQIQAWGKAAVVAGGVAAGVAVAYKTLSAGYETLLTNERLYSATAGVNIAGLRKATRGLVDDTTLLTKASALMHGNFKLNQKQMEIALSGARAMRHEYGIALPEALDIVTKSLTEGNVEAWKQLGKTYPGVKNESRAATEAMIQHLDELSLKHRATELSTDDMTAAVTEWDNAMDSLGESVGRVAVALTPLVSALASVAGGIADAAGAIPGWMIPLITAPVTGLPGIGYKVYGALSDDDNMDGQIAGVLGQYAKQKELADVQDKARKSLAEILKNRSDLMDMYGKLTSNGPNPTKRGKSKANPVDFSGSVVEGTWERNEREAMEAAMASTYAVDNSAARKALSSSVSQHNVRLGYNPNEQEDIANAIQSISDSMPDQDQTMLSALFGTPSDIDLHVQGISTLAMGFDGLVGAAGAGFDAMITGSESFGSAFKGALAESLRAMAVNSGVEALRQLAYGFGALAIGDPGAAAHFHSATLHTAVGLLAGGAASLMGAGQSSSAPTPTPSANSSSPRTNPNAVGTASYGGGDNNASNNVYIIGDDFGSLSNRERKSRFKQISRSAGVSVSGDVVVDG